MGTNHLIGQSLRIITPSGLYVMYINMTYFIIKLQSVDYITWGLII